MTIDCGNRRIGHGGRRWLPLALAVVTLVATPAFAEGPLLQLDHLQRLASVAKEVVDVNVDPSLLQLASGLLASPKSNDGTTRAVVSGLKAIYVKSLEFDREGAY